jgi:transcriptional regulator with XRE-family HTH domain
MRVGRIVRSLRRHHDWRQVDLGRRAVCSQQAVSLIECGHGSRLSCRTLERVVVALDAELDVSVRWRGGEIERLLDEGHAALESAIASDLEAAGWEVRIEVTYAIGRERGSIDVFAFEPRTGALLVVEVKRDVLSAEATARKHDEKVRLGAQVARERFGWTASTVSSALVLPEGRTARRRIEAHAELFRRLYPIRARAFRRWLRSPTGPVRALLFRSNTTPVGDRRILRSSRRVRTRVNA